MAALDFPSSPATGQIFQQSESQPTWMWDGSVWMMLAKPKGVDTGGFRNLFINGDMGVYRRNFPGASYVGAAYLADRWQWQSAGTQVTAAWPVIAPGSLVGIEASRTLQMSVVSVAGAANYGGLVQKIEHVQSLISNEPYVLSGWVNTGAQSLKLGIDVQRYFGSGGSPSAQDVVARGQVITTASAWKRFIFPFTVPSLFGKVLGSDGLDYAFVYLWLDAGSNWNTQASSIGQQSGTWQFTNLQLERGIVATPFERRALAVERLLCQRFFNSGTYYMMYPSPSTGGFGSTESVEFPTTMRATPSMVRNWSGYGNVASFQAAGTYPWCHYESAYSTGMSNVYGTFSWEASAEL